MLFFSYRKSVNRVKHLTIIHEERLPLVDGDSGESERGVDIFVIELHSVFACLLHTVASEKRTAPSAVALGDIQLDIRLAVGGHGGHEIHRLAGDSAIDFSG